MTKQAKAPATAQEAAFAEVHATPQALKRMLGEKEGLAAMPNWQQTLKSVELQVAAHKWAARRRNRRARGGSHLLHVAQVSAVARVGGGRRGS
ncbi:MAG TPA: hypothetical protein VGK67_41780 [Myxococcales bacterium]